MAQDYAKKKGGSAPRKGGSSGIPGWVWLIAGVVTGAFAMFLIYLAGINPSKPGKPAKPETAVAAETTPKPAPEEKPTFEFYESLTNNKVIPPKAPAKTSTNTAGKASYILQAASFKNPQDADGLKAQLILEGLDTRIEKFNRDGETWHRVLVGPFTDETKMAQAKTILAQHKITPIVLQKKPGT